VAWSSDCHVDHFNVLDGFETAFPASIHLHGTRTKKKSADLNKLLAHMTATRWEKNRPLMNEYDEFIPTIDDLITKFEAALPEDVRQVYLEHYQNWERIHPATVLQTGLVKLQTKRIPIQDLRQEEGASELARSPDMEPYLEYMMTEMQGADVQPRLEALSKLSLEKRYVWRVASALKWGFADFDDVTVAADRDTLNPDDFAKVVDLLKFRPIQFCMFLKVLVGAEEMKRMMLEAILFANKET
jgi:hypothetical protein